MEKEILILAIITTFLLLTIPCIPAVEYKICSNGTESQNIDKLKNKEMSILEKFKELKHLSLIKIRKTLQNIDIYDFKEDILNDIEKSELTVQEKSYVEKLLNSQQFFNILFKGIIIPMILYSLPYLFIKIIDYTELDPIVMLSFIAISWMISVIVPTYFIIPVAYDIENLTGLSYLSAYVLLAIIDIMIPYLIWNNF